MSSEKKRRNTYMKLFEKYPSVLRVEELCEALGGVSTKTGYKTIKEVDKTENIFSLVSFIRFL